MLSDTINNINDITAVAAAPHRSLSPRDEDLLRFLEEYGACAIDQLREVGYFTSRVRANARVRELALDGLLCTQTVLPHRGIDICATVSEELSEQHIVRGILALDIFISLTMNDDCVPDLWFGPLRFTRIFRALSDRWIDPWRASDPVPLAGCLAALTPDEPHQTRWWYVVTSDALLARDGAAAIRTWARWVRHWDRRPDALRAFPDPPEFVILARMPLLPTLEALLADSTSANFHWRLADLNTLLVRGFADTPWMLPRGASAE
jgi:hypothetical protein